MSELKSDKPKYNVQVSLGYTVNMGDFESARIDIGVSSDPREGETVDQTFNRVYNYVEARLEEKVSDQRGETSNG